MTKNYFLSLLLLLSISTISNAQIVPLPYFDDFEGVNAGWTTDSVSGSNWELGLPSTAPTNSVHSGVNGWDVDLDNVYLSNTECYLISPDFDFSNAASFNSILSFWQNCATEIGFDGARIDYSTNGGVSWAVLGALGSPGATNWYTNGGIGSSGQSAWDGNSNGWIKSTFNLGIFNGSPAVRFRFAFNSDPSTEVSGFTMDDFGISPPAINDVGVSTIIDPVNSLAAGLNSPVNVVIKNFGANFQNSFPASFTLNGGAPVVFNWTGLIGPGSSDTVVIGNFIVPSGLYSLCVYTGLPGDGNNSNDTICSTLFGVSQAFTVSLIDSLGIIGCLNPPFIDQFWVFGSAPTLSDGDTVTVDLAFGDGQQSTFLTTVSSGAFYVQTLHTYQFTGQFSAQAIATSFTGLSDTANNYNQVIIIDTCGNISGQVYADINNNCIMDGVDYPLAGIPVYLMQTGNVVNTYYTSYTGSYYFVVPSASTFDLKIDTNYTGITGYCPVSGTITGVTEPSAGNNFAFVPSVNFDLEPVMYPFTIRATGSSLLFLQARENNFTILPTGTLKLVLDTNLLQVSSSVPPVTTTNGDTLIWNMTNVGSSYSQTPFNVSLLVDPKTPLVINDTICFTVIAEPVSGDVLPANNIKTICGLVVNSYDPNNKTVEPSGIGTTGNIDPATSSFSYTVNFQNTGNSPAYNIFILDTIDSDLDMSSLHITGSSHLATTTIVASNVVKFSFNNIFLPDSASDEPGSHGYVNYTIAPKPGLPDGTQITNTAYIYFDFNPAIVTNTTTNTIDYTLSIADHLANKNVMLLYPNPAQEVVNVFINQNTGGDLILSDVFGKQVLVQQIKGGKQQLALKGLSDGIYFITFRSGSVFLSEKLMILK